MRNILFRGKTEDDRWVYSYLFIIGKGSEYEETYILGDIDHRDSIYDVWKNAERVIPETVGQWTGLYDKNGVKMFEDDVVTVPEHMRDVNGLYRVFYSEISHCYCLARSPVYHYHLFTFSDLNGFAETSIVIGNVYDNPELVQGYEYD